MYSMYAGCIFSHRSRSSTGIYTVTSYKPTRRHRFLHHFLMYSRVLLKDRITCKVILGDGCGVLQNASNQTSIFSVCGTHNSNNSNPYLNISSSGTALMALLDPRPDSIVRY